MRIARVVTILIWGLLSAWLTVWVIEKLTRADQRTSALPFLDSAEFVGPMTIGIAWGFATMGLGLVLLAGRREGAA